MASDPRNSPTVKAAEYDMRQNLRSSQRSNTPAVGTPEYDRYMEDLERQEGLADDHKEAERLKNAPVASTEKPSKSAFDRKMEQLMEAERQGELQEQREFKQSGWGY